jgi:hypothetical protein
LDIATTTLAGVTVPEFGLRTKSDCTPLEHYLGKGQKKCWRVLPLPDFTQDFSFSYRHDIPLAERMATIVETTQGVPAAEINDAQSIDVPNPANEEPEGKLSRIDLTTINGGPEDSKLKAAETVSKSDTAQMQKTIEALETEVEQLREKLK